MSREAMKLALEALKNFEKAGLATLTTIDAITALKQALEQPEPAPVAWIINHDLEEVRRHGRRALVLHSKPITNGIETPLYTTPPQRKPWVGLTEQEHTDIAVECGCMSSDWVFYGATVERLLKEKNS